MISVRSTSPIRSATQVSRLVPRLREAHRASTTSASPTDTAYANFASPVKASDGIEPMVYQTWCTRRSPGWRLDTQPNRVARSGQGLHRRSNPQQFVLPKNRTAHCHVRVAVYPPNDRSSKGRRDVVVVTNWPCSDRDIRDCVRPRVVQTAAGRALDDERAKRAGLVSHFYLEETGVA